MSNILGIIHPKKGITTVKSVFVDNNGKIRTILHYLQELGKNIGKILRIIEDLQIRDKNTVAMLAN